MSPDAVLSLEADVLSPCALGAVLNQESIAGLKVPVVAGGAKTLASPRNDFEREFILEQVRMSVRLHHTKQVFLMSHSDCATYGGLEAFGNDRQREMEHHRHELQRAAELVHANFPALAAKCFFLTFEGVHSSEPVLSRVA